MKIHIKRDDLLKPLSYISNVVERRQTLPILSNAYIRLDGGTLSLTGTDLEVEVITSTETASGEDGELTVSARKLLDICRALPEGSDINISLDGEKATVQSGRSRFALQTLPAGDYPRLETEQWELELTVAQKALKGLLERTAFSMAQQDVRYYLNGLLLDIDGSLIRSVATDGHRLAKSEIALETPAGKAVQVIVPRKAVMELIRFLDDSDTQARVAFNPNHVRVTLDNLVFTSKLIDGRYPDYEKVIPTGMPIKLVLDHNQFRDTLGRAAILTNEKFRGVKLAVASGQLNVTAHNPDQEEASDEMAIDYQGGEVEIGFNVSYLIDAINALPGGEVEFEVKDQNSSCILRQSEDTETMYLVMPMRI